MKSYTLATTLALIVGWVAALLFHSLFSILIFGGLKGGDFTVVAFWSFLFLMLANGLFIQVPERFIGRLCRRISRLKFILISIFYALVCFTLLIGWLWIQAIYNDGNRTFGIVVYAEAVIIGLGFGICFPRLWKYATPS